jgi:ribosomal protein L11 methylase PrmA
MNQTNPTQVIQETPGEQLPSSWRDPAGFMIRSGGLFKRVITQLGSDDFQFYRASGLHAELVESCMVLDFEEEATHAPAEWAHVLVPEQLAYVSYPWEWSFDQLKDAALLTLALQDRALRRGLSLKDASAYNVQFRGSKAIFIDTLSFERDNGGPWVAYEQFCRQFLAPLLLMSYVTPNANRYLRVDIEGMPLREASKILPIRSWLQPGALLHLHLHARAGGRGPYTGAQSQARSSHAKGPLVESLRKAIESIRSPRWPAAWTNYYEEGRFYSLEASASKLTAVRELTAGLRPDTVFDLGANTGVFAQLFAQNGATCIAYDSDTACVNQLYLQAKQQGSNILPLVMDLANPSPSLGFGLNTTLSLLDRPQADLVLCLALIHHLRFTERLPLSRIADFLARLGRWLLIEFVPTGDASADLLRHGRDGFGDYTIDGFLARFGAHYHLRGQRALGGSTRTLYLFERRG